MQVFVKSLTEETATFLAQPDEQIIALKKRISARQGVNFKVMNLFFEGTSMDDQTTLEDSGIENLSTIHASLALMGGKKKKKRKTYTTKKKNKHRHKTVKLHTLQYYSIDEENNTVSRLRKFSPEYGPGTWLAKHQDRHHCGKSGRCFRNDEEIEQN